jgi:peptidyl-prolyl cis-trans isomerase C
VITQNDLNQEVSNLSRQYGGQASPEQMAQMKGMLEKQALDNLVVQELLKQTAIKDKISVTEAEVDAKVKEVQDRFPSLEKFKETLKGAGLTEEGLRAEVTQSMKMEKLLATQWATIKEVGDEEITKFYNDNPDQFKMNEQVKASHILLEVKPDETDEVKAEKKKKLEDLKKQIENGADFAELAKANSSCPSKDKGGDLGFFERGRMVKPFEEVAFKLKTGELSDIVETKFGYHLIKVTDHKDASVVSLEDSKEKIAEYLTNQKKQQVVKDYVEQLKNNAKIEYAP